MGFNNNAGNTSANPSSFSTRQVHYDLQEERDLGMLTAGPADATAGPADATAGPADATAVVASPPPGPVSLTYVCYAMVALSLRRKRL
jgi:hypothetical protein